MKSEYCKGKMSADGAQLRRGPWTLEEDTMLIRYTASHGEGQWNLLARCSGLKRTGKSCRLRWLNYLKPDIKRGNLTPQEKSIISELHSKWGNRWSKIALHLPGRTDNEIKNYWRTRTQSQARQLKQAESDRFLESVRTFCVPTVNQTNEDTATATKGSVKSKDDHYCMSSSSPPRNSAFPSQDGSSSNPMQLVPEQTYKPIISRENADTDLYTYKYPSDAECYYSLEDLSFATMSPIGADDSGLFPGCQAAGDYWMDQEYDMTDSAWNTDELWQFR